MKRRISDCGIIIIIYKTVFCRLCFVRLGFQIRVILVLLELVVVNRGY